MPPSDSHGTAAEPAASGDGATAPEADGGLRRFIFYRELAEVYLLLDNVSASTSKSLPATVSPLRTGDESAGATQPGGLDAPDGAPKPRPSVSGAGTPAADWIEEICRIGWPPQGSNEELANQAATLIRARDALNVFAAPATGATIAFTLLVAGEEDNAKDHVPRLSWWRRGLLRLAGAGQHQRDHAPLALPPGPGWGEEAPSRRSLANIAFPNLAKPARQFRAFSAWLMIGLGVAFILTSVLSWNIATGNALLKQLTTLEATKAAPTGQSAAKSPSDDQLQLARENLRHWADGWSWLGRLPEAPTTCPALTASCPVVNEQWCAVLLNVLGGAVLPICYGLLGAGAAVARSIVTRIRESLLAPRHLMLFLMQLALGAIIGGCIGLFVTPSGGTNGPSDTTPSGILGSVPLSASALCFIAGFGVDGVFLALEGLIGRVFNIPDPTKPSPAALARRGTT